MTWNSTLKRKTPMRRAVMKATSKRKAATKAERAYMSAQAHAGCILCRHLGLGPTPAEIHHLRHGLGRREFERVYGVTEMDLWTMAQKKQPGHC